MLWCARLEKAVLQLFWEHEVKCLCINKYKLGMHCLQLSAFHLHPTREGGKASLGNIGIAAFTEAAEDIAADW